MCLCLICSSSDEEIRDVSDSEDGEGLGEGDDSSLNQTMSTVSFFLVFYHLTYRLSECAVNTLIGFLRVLFHFLSMITGHALLVELARAFPRTLHGARTAYKETNFIEYAVCLKCNVLLYDY